MKLVHVNFLPLKKQINIYKLYYIVATYLKSCMWVTGEVHSTTSCMLHELLNFPRDVKHFLFVLCDNFLPAALLTDKGILLYFPPSPASFQKLGSAFIRCCLCPLNFPEFLVLLSEWFVLLFNNFVLFYSWMWGLGNSGNRQEKANS